MATPTSHSLVKSLELKRLAAEADANQVSGKALAKAVAYMIKDLDWSNSEFAKILHLKPRTLNQWLRNKEVPIQRSSPSPEAQVIIHALAIHRSLSSMFENSILKQEWMSTVHSDLKASPKEIMARSIDGLIDVRRYLDFVRGRGA